MGRSEPADARRLVDDARIKRMLGEVSDFALYALDANGVCTAWEPYSDLYRIATVEEMVGRRLDLFLPEKDRIDGVYDRALAKAAADGRCEGEGWRQYPGRPPRWMRYIIEAVRDDRGVLEGFVGISSDITARHRVDAELAAAQDALVQSQRLRSLGELTGGIAHDFNNLLTVIRGSAELLTRPGLDPDKRLRQLEAIILTADRAAELTGQLLAFARRQPLRPTRTDLNLQIAGMADLLRRTLGRRIFIEARPAAGLWPVMADRAQLRSLILNAAINARGAIAGEGSVTLITENVSAPGGDEVRLAIVDDGCGMTEEVRARAFEPFFTTRPVGQGSGLGLSQAYGFALQSGGRVELAGAPGEGTTLSLYLPRASGQGAVETVSEDDPPLARGTRVLLVEDSRTVAVFARALLEDLGCDIVHAASAEEALLAIDNEGGRFDVVFSDIVMPGLSGLELAARVRAERPRMPILLATGYSEAAARGDGGEFPILPKPYRREALARMLGETIEMTRLAA